MSLNQNKYHTFAALLKELLHDTANQLTVAEIREHLVLLQQFFQEEIVPLANDESRERMFRTEISKQLRLLEVDVGFLAGASQPATIESRLKTICDRILTLIRYCEAVLGDGE
jgi:hypothetical protein